MPQQQALLRKVVLVSDPHFIDWICMSTVIVNGYQLVSGYREAAALLGITSVDPETQRAVNVFFESFDEHRSDLVKREYPDPALAQAAKAILTSRQADGIHTPLWINLGALRDGAVDIGIAVAAAAMSGGNPATAGLSAAIRHGLKAANVIVSLPEDEAEVAHVILYLSGGRAYKEPLLLSDLRNSFDDSTFDLAEILNSLTRRGVVKIEGDGIRLVW